MVAIKHDYEAIVREALEQPGKLHEAYTAFWSYSMGNQMLAMMQLGRAEPISTYQGWKALGRQVKKGEKAIALLMPVFKKVADEVTGEEGKRTFFISRHNWFGLHSTEGLDYTPAVPEFDMRRAADALTIRIEEFQCVDGNCQGYAKTDERVIAVSPIAYDPLKTFAHETAHVLLHSGITSIHGEKSIPKDVREAEAELSSYLLASALGHTGNLEYSRGYIQHYMGETTVDQIRFSKVFNAVDTILKAGREPERPMETNNVPSTELSIA